MEHIICWQCVTVNRISDVIHIYPEPESSLRKGSSIHTVVEDQRSLCESVFVQPRSRDDEFMTVNIGARVKTIKQITGRSLGL